MEAVQCDARTRVALPAATDTAPITIYKPCSRDDETPFFATYAYADADAHRFEGTTDRFTFDHVSVTPKTQELRGIGHPAGPSCRPFLRQLESWSHPARRRHRHGLRGHNRILGPDRHYGIIQPPVPPRPPSPPGRRGDATRRAGAALSFSTNSKVFSPTS